MENEENTNKNTNKGITALILILIIIICGLSTYIIYNNINQNSKSKESININESKESTHSNISSQTNIKSYNYTDLEEFWKGFRKAILSNNYEEITNYVNFPLQTRGPYDSDQIININKEQFETTFNKYLNEEDGLGETNKIWIEKNEMPEEINNENDNTVRLGNMIIKKDNNYWKLSFIYTNID